MGGKGVEASKVESKERRYIGTESTVIDLPVQENISTDPITFSTMDVSRVKLLFDIVPTYAGSKERVVGRGVAMLSSVKQMVGSQRMNLKGDVSVPIVAANTLDVIGSVNFNFLVITPFSHPNLSITENQTYWRTMASTMVIGHRGELDFGFFLPCIFLTFVKVWAKISRLESLCNSARTRSSLSLLLPT